MQFMKRQLPVVIAFLAGLLLWAQFYIPSRLSQQALETFTSSWAIILAGAALILGILSAIQHHWNKVRYKKPGHAYSAITLFCFAVVVIVGWLPWHYVGVTNMGHIKDGSVFDWIFQNMFIPLDATMFSLLAFYIASAAFRAFRARSFEATALLISGVIVMIGRVPLGEMLAFDINGTEISFTSVAGWILNNPNTAAQRGILLGVLLSIVAISLRIMFGIERTYMGGGD